MPFAIKHKLIWNALTTQICMQKIKIKIKILTITIYVYNIKI